MRIVPHDQDTGAFFIAVLQVGSASKTQTEAADMNGQAETVMERWVLFCAVAFDLRPTGKPPANSDDTTNVPCKRPPADSEDAPAKKAKVEKEFKIPGPLDRKWGEDPFIYLPDDDEALREVKEIYGISDDFPFQQTVTRSVGPRHKTIYFTSNDVKSLLQAKDVHRLKVVNAGLKLFVRNDSDKGALTPYRVHSEGLPYLVGHLSEKRVIKGVPAQDIFTLLQTEYPKLSEFTPETAEKLASMGW